MTGVQYHQISPKPGMKCQGLLPVPFGVPLHSVVVSELLDRGTVWLGSLTAACGRSLSTFESATANFHMSTCLCTDTIVTKAPFQQELATKAQL